MKMFQLVCNHQSFEVAELNVKPYYLKAFLHFYSLSLREAFKNKNDETYGIFHMLVTYGKFFRDFLLSKNDF